MSVGAESCDRDFGVSCPREFVNVGRIKGGALALMLAGWMGGASLGLGAFDFCAATSQCVDKSMVMTLAMPCLGNVMLRRLISMLCAFDCSFMWGSSITQWSLIQLLM